MKIAVSSYSFSQYIRDGRLTQLTCIAKAKNWASTPSSSPTCSLRKASPKRNTPTRSDRSATVWACLSLTTPSVLTF